MEPGLVPTAQPPAQHVPGVDLERVFARVAPTRPLDRFIAVNPLWGMIDRPLPAVAAELGALAGTRLLMPRRWYREELRAGRITDGDLLAAIEQTESELSLSELRALLDRDEPAPAARARVVDVVDASRDLVRQPSWRDFVVRSISQVCAAYFDDGQAQLRAGREQGLYAAWRRHAALDRSPELLMGLTDARVLARGVPADPRELIAAALAALDVAPAERELYASSLMLDVSGWASWCAYRRWTARLAGGDDSHLIELLAIRTAWEWLLYRAGDAKLATRWQHAMAMWPAIDVAARRAQENDWLFQRALEIAWQRQACAAIPAGLVAERPTAPAAQAVFCIDVRSEVLRRALEATTPRLQTLGFAGFFGMPIDYRPAGAPEARPQLPGLLAPSLRASDGEADGPLAEQRAARSESEAAWAAIRRDPFSAFAFVEAIGLGYGAALAGELLGWGKPAATAVGATPRLIGTVGGAPLDHDARAELAAGMLRAMSLTRGLARIVLLAGHGSQTRNNPHAAGLDCGACCGQTGEVNARAAAALLNDPAVRARLPARGIEVPEHTWFVPALHDTTTDDVTLFDTEAAPRSHVNDLATLRTWLSEAGIRAREERAARLGLGRGDHAGIEREIRRRARDWSEVRPEWGLADNAAFLVGPREHFAHLDLAGRAFLHEYRFEEDEGLRTLELILTAPMIVTHWINFQYYASTVDNPRYGSGRALLDNEWLHFFQIDRDARIVRAYRRGRWLDASPSS